jgi:transcription elongation factor Elf1
MKYQIKFHCTHCRQDRWAVAEKLDKRPVVECPVCGRVYALVSGYSWKYLIEDEPGKAEIQESLF